MMGKNRENKNDEQSKRKEKEKNKSKGGKFPGKEVPDNSDELMIQMASAQLRADYRKSLGKEHSRRSWDVEISRIIKRGAKDKTEKKEESKDSRG